MRTFDSGISDLLDAGRVKYAGMIRFDLGEGSYGFIRRTASYDYGGITYQPMPKGMIAVSAFSHTSGTAASGFTLQLAESPDDGLTPAVLIGIEDYDYRDRAVTVFDLHQHPDTHAVLAAPVAQMRGYINRIVHDENPDSGYIMSVECETRAIDNSRTNSRLRSHADQTRRSAGDLVYEHAGTTGRIKINFGKK